MRVRSAAGEAGKAGAATEVTGAAVAPPKPSVAREATRVVGALAAVLGLIFFLRWAARRLYAVPTIARSNGAVRVLSRTVLSPKQQLVLLQVGKRVVVVADGGAQMSALCQITEPDEVAHLIGQLQADKQPSGDKAFGSLFGRMRKRFDSETEAPEPASSVNADTRPAGGRLDITDTEEEPNVEAIDDTRHELNGLLEKVRLVSGQFRRM